MIHLLVALVVVVIISVGVIWHQTERAIELWTACSIMSWILHALIDAWNGEGRRDYSNEMSLEMIVPSPTVEHLPYFS